MDRACARWTPGRIRYQIHYLGVLMPKSNPYRLLLATCPDHENALAIARHLLESRAAACVNILPGLHSVYRWQGRVEEATEHLLMVKTRTERYATAEAAIRSLHPYELPEIVSVPIETGLPAYLAWIDTALSEEQ